MTDEQRRSREATATALIELKNRLGELLPRKAVVGRASGYRFNSIYDCIREVEIMLSKHLDPNP